MIPLIQRLIKTLGTAAIAVAVLTLRSSAADSQNVRAYIVDEKQGWRALVETDFARVNSAEDTWSWTNGLLHCTGLPISVMRTAKQYRNFEMVVEWSHQKAGGNSGVFAWVTP